MEGSILEDREPLGSGSLGSDPKKQMENQHTSASIHIPTFGSQLYIYIYILIWQCLEIGLCRSPPLCYKPLSPAFACSTVVFTRLVAWRVCRKNPRFCYKPWRKKGRRACYKPMFLRRCHIYIYICMYIEPLGLGSDLPQLSGASCLPGRPAPAPRR